MGRPHHTPNADGLRPSYSYLPRGETYVLTRALCVQGRCMLKNLWKDPVFSKVIAAAIIWLLGTLILKASSLIEMDDLQIYLNYLLSTLALLILIIGLIRFRKIRNRAKTIVFLSIGGTCRDPIAKVVTEKLFEDNGVTEKIDIKALAVDENSDLKVSHGARYAINSTYGQDLLAKHKCGVITKEIAKSADLILVMSLDVLKMYKQKFPNFNNNVYLFKEFFGLQGDVFNPWPDGRDEATLKRYSDCAEEIKEILTTHYEKLVNAV